MALKSSTGSHDPIFNSTVKAEAGAEPNSREDANNGSSCRQRQLGNYGLQNIGYKNKLIFNSTIAWVWPSSARFDEEAALLYLEGDGRIYPSQHCL